MNAHKHMEVIFGAVMVVAVGLAAMPARQAAPSQPAQMAHPAQIAQPATAQPIPVVVIKGKRMTDVEKRASLGAEPRPET